MEGSRPTFVTPFSLNYLLLLLVVVVLGIKSGLQCMKTGTLLMNYIFTSFSSNHFKCLVFKYIHFNTEI